MRASPQFNRFCALVFVSLYESDSVVVKKVISLALRRSALSVFPPPGSDDDISFSAAGLGMGKPTGNWECNTTPHSGYWPQNRFPQGF